jgi:hypothetical protein
MSDNLWTFILPGDFFTYLSSIKNISTHKYREAYFSSKILSLVPQLFVAGLKMLYVAENNYIKLMFY